MTTEASLTLHSEANSKPTRFPGPCLCSVLMFSAGRLPSYVSVHTDCYTGEYTFWGSGLFRVVQSCVPLMDLFLPDKNLHRKDPVEFQDGSHVESMGEDESREENLPCTWFAKYVYKGLLFLEPPFHKLLQPLHLSFSYLPSLQSILSSHR